MKIEKAGRALMCEVHLCKKSDTYIVMGDSGNKVTAQFYCKQHLKETAIEFAKVLQAEGDTDTFDEIAKAFGVVKAEETKEPAQDKFVCDKCGKDFETKKQLAGHKMGCK